MLTRYFEKNNAVMKPTLLIATLSMLISVPGAFAATELEALRARYTEKEQELQILHDQIKSLEESESSSPKAPEPKAVAAPKAPVAPPVATAIYIVKPGDFLEKIARKNHCSAAALAKANGLKPSSMLHPGQKLKLPGTASAPETSSKPVAKSPLAGKTHKIQEGETYSSIGRKYGVSVESLIAANPNAKATALRPGQVIRLAKDAPAPPPVSEVKTLPSAAPVQMPSIAAVTPVPAPAPTPAPEVPASPPVSAAPTPLAAAPKTIENPPSSTPKEESTSSSAPEKKIRSVTIEGEMSYAEFAAKHGTSIDRLNDLNGLDLTNSTVLAKGSELYVPAQP